MFLLFSDICSNWLERTPDSTVIGGVHADGTPMVVQIDESLVAKPKYGRGHFPEQFWVFGGYCQEQHKGFLVYVPRRDRPTLWAKIREHIRPGSRIISDQWAAYNGLETMPVCFHHF